VRFGFGTIDQGRPGTTVSVADALVARPNEFVKTARYSVPLIAVEVWATLSAANVTLNVEEVPPVTPAKDFPPFVDACHCTVGVGLPLAVAEKLAVVDAVTNWVPGWMVTAGFEGSLNSQTPRP
jgi:hypothetical protein